MNGRAMLMHSVRRLPPPIWLRGPTTYGSQPSCTQAPREHRLASLFISVTYGEGAPTVLSFTVGPAVPRLPSVSKGAGQFDLHFGISLCAGPVTSATSRPSVQ